MKNRLFYFDAHMQFYYMACVRDHVPYDVWERQGHFVYMNTFFEVAHNIIR